MSQFHKRLKGWGDRCQGSRATPLLDRQEFYGGRTARKAPGILPRRGEGRNARVAALSNVELITALLSCNRQLAIVGLQLRIINGVVSLLTTEVNNKALAQYLSEQNHANGISGLTTSELEVLACIALSQC
jgi:hypothetical protein